MTVVREQQRIYPMSSDRVLAAIRDVLEGNESYKNVEEGPSGTFKTVVKSMPIVLPTPLTIRAETIGDATAVTVRVESQEMIAGDIFNMYNRYIQEFLDTLRNRLGNA